jgi:3-methyladenine DNA glycosylase/8-oxoguanine DNA glycosylase
MAVPAPSCPTEPATWFEVDAPRSLRSTLAAQRAGRADPTTRLGDGVFVHTTLTPDGPGTLRVTWRADPSPAATCGLDADAWGPGAGWLLGRVDTLTGAADRAVAFHDAHPAVARSLAATRTRRIGASGNLYHHLLPTVLAQRITAAEALRQWAALCRELGERPPGPDDVVAGMRMPPAPAAIARRPAWWYHHLGVEAKRSRALDQVARHADSLWGWADAGAATAGARLSLLPGIGPWTVGSVLGPALGDPDAVPVGDFHFPHAVAWALAGEPRADDSRMLDLLRPYRGQRGRVLSAVLRTCGSAPAFGPRRRTTPVATL